ncbi:MAG TPA: hypothetical protein PL045_01995 [Chitinophagaceae bacterium]|nr:hypothetical protein [Chitinophagaceae bacterium]
MAGCLFLNNLITEFDSGTAAYYDKYLWGYFSTPKKNFMTVIGLIFIAIACCLVVYLLKIKPVKE